MRIFAGFVSEKHPLMGAICFNPHHALIFVEKRIAVSMIGCSLATRDFVGPRLEL
jgi:hypothetical protein